MPNDGEVGKGVYENRGQSKCLATAKAKLK